MGYPAEAGAAKAALRRQLKDRLAALEGGSAERAARGVAREVLRLPEVSRARRVFTCLSFGSEIDTRGLVRALLAGGKEVYVPRTDRGDDALHVHRYPCPLRTLAFGLEQPVPDAPEVPPEALDATLDVALIVGLAFDRRGYRLGYGAGYFDRFLRDRPFPGIGLAYGFQVLPRLPAEPHDVPMSLVVTENEVLRVPAASLRKQGADGVRQS